MESFSTNIGQEAGLQAPNTTSDRQYTAFNHQAAVIDITKSPVPREVLSPLATCAARPFDAGLSSSETSFAPNPDQRGQCQAYVRA